MASFAELWQVEFGSWRYCTVFYGFCLFYIVVVDSGLTCGLIFGDLPCFKYCMMVMASSRSFLTFQDSCCYSCMDMAGS